MAERNDLFTYDQDVKSARNFLEVILNDDSNRYTVRASQMLKEVIDRIVEYKSQRAHIEKIHHYFGG